MRKGLILVSLLGFMAGCGGSSGNKDGGAGGGGGSSEVDMAQPVSTHDLAAPPTPADMTQLSCSAIIDCSNAATSNAAAQACIDAGTPTAQTLINAVLTCFQNTCSSTSSSNTDPCLQSQDACVSCSQTGTATTDMGSINGGNCVASQGGATQTSSVCGTCIVPLYNCEQDK